MPEIGHVDARAARRQLVAQLYGAGLSKAAVAEQLGIAATTVTRDLMALDVPRRPPGGRPATLPRDLISMYASGNATLRQLAAQAGIGRTGVTNALRRAGVEMQPRGKPRVSGDHVTCARRDCTCVTWRWTSELAIGRGRYCSISCELVDFWTRGAGATSALVARWPGVARSRWFGRWAGRQVGRQGGRPGPTPEQRTHMIELFEKGMSIAAVARMTGASKKRAELVRTNWQHASKASP